MQKFLDKLAELFESRTPFVQVYLVDTVGSVPQNAGSKMLVTAAGWYWGTVGGGKVEKRAIEEAQSMLKAFVEGASEGASEGESGTRKGYGDSKTKFVSWNLNKDIGMTCGGSVKLYFEVENASSWEVAIFGAGHVGRAIIDVLSRLDCKITCFDTREEWLSKIPDCPGLEKVLSNDLPSEVSGLSKQAFVVLVTMGHTTDKPVLIEVLSDWQTRPFPYVGVIGSKAKAQRLKEDIEQAGLPGYLKDVFYCPMGLSLGSNHPGEIAISIVSQLLQIRDKKNLV